MSQTSPVDKSAAEETPTANRKKSPTTSRERNHEEVSSADGWQSSRWVTIATLALAVVAVGLAVAAWFHPVHPGAHKFSGQQAADAKTNVCGAYNTVHQGVVANTHMANPGPNDPAGQLSVAANARLALVGGGAFLRDRVAAEPAAPADLAKAVGAMANTIDELGVGYLAGLNSTLDPLRHNLDAEIAQINQLCG